MAMEVTKGISNKKDLKKTKQSGVSVKHGIRLQCVKEFLRELKQGGGGRRK